MCKRMRSYVLYCILRLNKYHGTVAVYQKAMLKSKTNLKNPESKDIEKRYFDQPLKLKDANFDFTYMNELLFLPLAMPLR